MSLSFERFGGAWYSSWCSERSATPLQLTDRRTPDDHNLRDSPGQPLLLGVKGSQVFGGRPGAGSAGDEEWISSKRSASASALGRLWLFLAVTV